MCPKTEARELNTSWRAVQVGELNERLRHKHITLTLTDAALDYAVQQSYDHMCAQALCLALPAGP